MLRVVTQRCVPLVFFSSEWEQKNATTLDLCLIRLGLSFLTVQTLNMFIQILHGVH